LGSAARSWRTRASSSCCDWAHAFSRRAVVCRCGPAGCCLRLVTCLKNWAVCVKCKRDARTATAQQSAFSWPQRCMPVRLRQKIQTLPRSAGRRVALGRPNPLCYPNSGPTASILFGCFNFLTICPSRPPSLDGQHHCLPGGWRSAPSLRTSSRLRESRYVPARTPSNCHHVIFEQVQDLHHLLLAGLPAHFESYMPSQAVQSPPANM